MLLKKLINRLCIALLFLVLFSPLRAVTIYVDSSATGGLNNGTSWTNAYTALQTALTASIAGDTLWVANGTYYPGTSGAVTSSFLMKKNVVVLGGFEGYGGAEETSASQRNWKVNFSILSGDLDQSGSLTANDAYEVVDAINKDTTAVLDGFIVTGGNAIGGGNDNRGGGITCLNGGITVKNCVIEGNYASGFGGGIYANKRIKVYSTIFRNNATAGDGGGAVIIDSRLYNCVFVNNSAGNRGGGIVTSGSATQYVYHCSFSQNTSSNGAAIFSNGVFVPLYLLVNNSIIWANNGPEISNSGPAPTVSRCIVDGGYASGSNIINADPIFADGDLRIKACSPAVDAADSLLSITEDLDGNPRAFDGDGDLTAKWDLGAFEVQVVGVPPSSNPIIGPNPSCLLGDNVLYQVTTDNSPANTYLWSLPGGGGALDGPPDSAAVYIDWGGTLGSWVVQVIETVDLTGCSDTNQYAVVLDTAPVVTIVPAGNDSICLGDSILLNASGTGVSLQWYLNGAIIPGATGASIYANDNGFHNVILTDGNGCKDSATVAYNLYLRPLPNVTFSPPGPVKVCAGSTVTITGLPGSTLQWYGNGSSLPGETGQTLDISSGGAYNQLVTDQYGCTDSAAAPLLATLYGLPVVTISPAANDTICPGDTLVFTASSPADTAWQWLSGGTPVPGATTNPWPATLSGYFNVMVTDTNGCVDTAATGVALTVDDFINPVAICKDTTLYIGPAGTISISASAINNGSSDNCNIDSLALSQNTFTCLDTGINSVTFTVFDRGGNQAICISNITVRDTTPPFLICRDTSMYIDAAGNLNLLVSDVNNGSNDNCSIDSIWISQSVFTCSDTGTVAITLYAMDPSGNMDSCTANVTIADSTSPVVICQDIEVFLDPGGNASIVPGDIDNGSSDNCGVAMMSLDKSAFTCSDVPGVNVTLTVKDVSGNSAFCTAFVRVRDTVPPVAVCKDTTIYLDASGMVIIGPAAINNGSTDNCSIASMSLSQDTFTCGDVGLNIVTLFVQDADTNISSCNANVTILDTIAPVAICTDTTFYMDSSGNAVVDPLIFGFSSYDNCGFLDSVWVDAPVYGCADSGYHPVKLFVRDVSGSLDSCQGNVYITDSMPPFVSCKDTTLILDGFGNASLTANDIDNGTTDNCSLDTLYASQTSFTCADVGVVPVILTAIDVFGNQSTCIANVTIQDTVFPVAICKDTTIYLDSTGTAVLTGSDLDNGSGDNCGIDTMYLSQGIFTCIDTGLNVVTLFVVDKDSNVVTCFSNVTVIDTISTVIFCRDTTIYIDSSGNFILLPQHINNGSFDNCSFDTMYVTPSVFTCADTGTFSVMFYVRDFNGNLDSCTANVTLKDSLAPVGMCADTVLYLDPSGNLLIGPSDIAPNAWDNCGIDTSFVDLSTFTCSDTGMHVVTVTFIDFSGNLSTCLLNLEVRDSVPPVATCSDTTVYLNASGYYVLSVPMINNGSSDECGINGWMLDRDTLFCADAGTMVVNLIVTDPSGNTSSCPSNVSVMDTISPSILCNSLTRYLDLTGQVIIDPNDFISLATDNCGIDSTWASQSLFQCSDFGTNNIDITVIDPSGNTATCLTTVNILDTIAPVAACDSLTLQLGPGGIAVLTPAMLAGGSYDNCSPDSMWVSKDTFACNDFGWNSVKFYIRDVSGAMDSCTGMVNVIDTLGFAVLTTSLPSDTISCNSALILLDAGPGYSSYNWSTGATTQSISVSTAGIYWVDIVSPGGCSGRDTITVSSYTAVPLNLQTESGQSSICMNDALGLLVNDNYQTYSWSNGSTMNTTIATTGGNYSITVQDTNGCIQSQSISITYYPFPAPNPQINPAGPVTQCANEGDTLDAGGGYFAYLWNTGQTTQQIFVTNPGFYNVEVWNGVGCHAVSDSVEVIEIAVPLPVISQVNDTLFVAPAGVAWQWIYNGSNIPGATNSYYVPTQTGNYAVLVTYSTGCKKSSGSYSFILGKPDAATTAGGFSIYPNPSDGHLTLVSENWIRGAVAIRINDLLGKKMREINMNSLTGPMEIDLSDIPGGIYFMKISSSGKEYSLKLIIE